jgi:CRP/FNR family transcriptional regulator, cyclic AMP receptor protein
VPRNLLSCASNADTVYARASMTTPRHFRARREPPEAPAAAGSPLASPLFDYERPEAAGVEHALTFLGERDEHDWEIVLGYTELRRFSAGEIVLRRGDRERALFLVTVGTLQVRPSQSSEVLRTIEAPSVVGEIAFLDGGARSADVVAVTASEVRRLSLDRFEALSARHPELGRAILFDLGRIAATRLRWLMDLAARGD